LVPAFPAKARPSCSLRTRTYSAPRTGALSARRLVFPATLQPRLLRFTLHLPPDLITVALRVLLLPMMLKLFSTPNGPARPRPEQPSRWPPVPTPALRSAA